MATASKVKRPTRAAPSRGRLAQLACGKAYRISKIADQRSAAFAATADIGLRVGSQGPPGNVGVRQVL